MCEKDKNKLVGSKYNINKTYNWMLTSGNTKCIIYLKMVSTVLGGDKYTILSFATVIFNLQLTILGINR